MRYNVDSLEFIKKKSKMNKDELFALGFIVGTISMASVTLKAQGLEDDDVEESVNSIFDKVKILDMWNKLLVELDLDARPLYEIMPEFLE